MRTVTIQFTKPLKKFAVASWLIRFFQRTKYSHVRLFWMGFGGEIPVVYEASGSHLKFIGPEAQDQLHVEVVSSHELYLTTEQYRELVRHCMNYASISYGKLQLLGIALVYIFRLKKNPFSDSRKSQVCSEVVGVFLEEILGWNTGLDLDIAGPKEIYKALIDKKRAS